ncbi:MAG: hypothetical protein IJR17_06855 [Clostridia bacterium]|nr:hypothetical protein [Clostridia bacterium]
MKVYDIAIKRHLDAKEFEEFIIRDDRIKTKGTSETEIDYADIDYAVNLYLRDRREKPNDNPENLQPNKEMNGDKTDISDKWDSVEERQNYKGLSQIDSIKYIDSNGIDLEDVHNALVSRFEEYEIPVLFRKGTISKGLVSSPTDAIFIVHPNNQNAYYKIVLTLSRMGKFLDVNVYFCGKSREMGIEALANTKVFNGAGVRGVTIGGLHSNTNFGVGYAIGSAVFGVAGAGIRAIKKGIGALTKDEGALEMERQWYQIVLTIINEVFCA